MFPSLQTTDKSGNVKLVDTKDAVKTVQGTLATDYRGLATYMSYVVNPRENLQLPDAQTLGRADALEESYKNNPELAAKDAPVVRSLMSRDEAVTFFEKMGEQYKVEIISSIDTQQDLSFYRQGDFIDLCQIGRASCRERVSSPV